MSNCCYLLYLGVWIGISNFTWLQTKLLTSMSNSNLPSSLWPCLFQSLASERVFLALPAFQYDQLHWRLHQFLSLEWLQLQLLVPFPAPKHLHWLPFSFRLEASVLAMIPYGLASYFNHTRHAPGSGYLFGFFSFFPSSWRLLSHIPRWLSASLQCLLGHLVHTYNPLLSFPWFIFVCWTWYHLMCSRRVTYISWRTGFCLLYRVLL